MQKKMSVIEAVKLVVDARDVVTKFEDPNTIRPAIAMDEEPVDVRMARWILGQTVNIEWLKNKFGLPVHDGDDIVWERKSHMYPNTTFRVTFIEGVYVQVERVTGCGTGQLVAPHSEVTVFKRGIEQLAKFYFFW